MLYTPALIELLKKHSIEIPEAQRDDHERKLKEGELSSDPFFFTSDQNLKKLALYNIPGIGPSIELCETEQNGRHGSVTKHLASTGKTFGLKTIKINSDEDFELFRQEHDALKKRHLLQWGKLPEKEGGAGLLAFPFYEGITLHKYLKKGGEINPYEISYLLLSKVNEVHADGLVHGSPHAQNFKVEQTKSGLVVHIFDYGRSKPVNYKNKKPLALDMVNLGRTLNKVFDEHLFSTNENELLLIEKLNEWMSGAAIISIAFVQNILRFAEYFSVSGTLDNRSKIELLDFLALAMLIADVEIFKKIVDQICKTYGDGALNEKNSEGFCIKALLSDFYKSSNEAFLKEMLSFVEKKAPKFVSISPNVVSLSDIESNESHLSPMQQRKFHFFK